MRNACVTGRLSSVLSFRTMAHIPIIRSYSRCNAPSMHVLYVYLLCAFSYWIQDGKGSFNNGHLIQCLWLRLVVTFSLIFNLSFVIVGVARMLILCSILLCYLESNSNLESRWRSSIQCFR